MNLILLGLGCPTQSDREQIPVTAVPQIGNQPQTTPSLPVTPRYLSTEQMTKFMRDCVSFGVDNYWSEEETTTLAKDLGFQQAHYITEAPELDCTGQYAGLAQSRFADSCLCRRNLNFGVSDEKLAYAASMILTQASGAVWDENAVKRDELPYFPQFDGDFFLQLNQQTADNRAQYLNEALKNLKKHPETLSGEDARNLIAFYTDIQNHADEGDGQLKTSLASLLSDDKITRKLSQPVKKVILDVLCDEKNINPQDGNSTFKTPAVRFALVKALVKNDQGALDYLRSKHVAYSTTDTYLKLLEVSVADPAY